MKLVIVLVMSVFSNFCWADQEKDLSEYQPLDMKQFEGLEKASAANKSFSFSIGCKTEDGKDLKSSDPGFEACLLKNQHKAGK